MGIETESNETTDALINEAVRGLITLIDRGKRGLVLNHMEDIRDFVNGKKELAVKKEGYQGWTKKDFNTLLERLDEEINMYDRKIELEKSDRRRY